MYGSSWPFLVDRFRDIDSRSIFLSGDYFLFLLLLLFYFYFFDFEPADMFDNHRILLF